MLFVAADKEGHRVREEDVVRGLNLEKEFLVKFVKEFPNIVSIDEENGLSFNWGFQSVETVVDLELKAVEKEEEEKKATKNIRQEREVLVQCAIIKVLKQVKKIQFEGLVHEVGLIIKLFKPQPAVMPSLFRSSKLESKCSSRKSSSRKLKMAALSTMDDYVCSIDSLHSLINLLQFPLRIYSVVNDSEYNSKQLQMHPKRYKKKEEKEDPNIRHQKKEEPKHCRNGCFCHNLLSINGICKYEHSQMDKKMAEDYKKLVKMRMIIVYFVETPEKTLKPMSIISDILPIQIIPKALVPNPPHPEVAYKLYQYYRA
jgi:hypothetical protein